MTLTLARFTFDNADPPWFWIGLVVASLVVLGLTYRGIYRRSGKTLTWALAALRVAGVLALIIALVKPAWINVNEDEEKPKLGIVLEQSYSRFLAGANVNPKVEVFGPLVLNLISKAASLAAMNP